MDWFKIWPSAYLNVINRIPDGLLRGSFSLLVLHCLNDGSLPDDDEEIGFTTGLPADHVAKLRPFLKRLARIEDGRIHIQIAEDTIRERIEFAEKKAKAGKKGGEQRQAVKGDSKNSQAVLSTASGNQAVLSTAKQTEAKPSQTNKQTNKEREERARAENPPGENPLTHPLGIALLEGAGFTADQREMLSPKNYSALGGAITRLAKGNVLPARVAEARKAWWGKNPPTFDQLADEALRIGSVKAQADDSPKIEMAPDWYAEIHKGAELGN